MPILTQEDYIYNIEPSRPRNPLIAEIVSLSGEIEKLGTGIKNIYNKCKEEKLKVKFEDKKTAFFVVVYRKNLEGLIENTEKDLENKKITNDTVNDTVKLNKTERKILNIIRMNHNITQSEIAKTLEIAEITVKRNTTKLKEKGLIERVGADKNGYWKIK